MFELREVTVVFGQSVIVEQTSRTFAGNRFTAIVGPNGAGKSTLLKLLTGELKPSSGAVLFKGLDIARQPARSLAGYRAVLSQSNHLSFPFSVYEVAGLGLQGASVDRKTRSRLIRHALESVELGGYDGRLYQQLSGGEQQRVQLARVLCQLEASSAADDEKFLFLDEPISSLDVRHQIKTLQVAKQYAKEGLGVVAVLHDLNLAARYADDVIVMRQGRCVADAAPEQAFTETMLERVFEVGFEVSADSQNRLRVSLCDIVDTPQELTARL
ncbi:MAG: heme ABC transporter ATP-binding protein [Pseudomonadota bacterium]